MNLHTNHFTTQSRETDSHSAMAYLLSRATRRGTRRVGSSSSGRHLRTGRHRFDLEQRECCYLGVTPMTRHSCGLRHEDSDIILIRQRRQRSGNRFSTNQNLCLRCDGCVEIVSLIWLVGYHIRGTLFQIAIGMTILAFLLANATSQVVSHLRACSQRSISGQKLVQIA